MDSRTAERASSDAKAAVAAFGVAGTWLSTVFSTGLGLQGAGLAAGAVVVGGAAVSILRRAPRFSTPADRITLLRAVLVGLVAVLAVPGLFTGRPADPLLVVVGCAAFLLDAVDGPVARRTGTASAAGARLDTSTDAALVLVLSFATAAAVGSWTFCIGAAYYVFQAAGYFRPHLRVPGVPAAAAAAALALALALLVFSFTRDVVELERGRHTGRLGRAEASPAAGTAGPDPHGASAETSM